MSEKLLLLTTGTILHSLRVNIHTEYLESQVTRSKVEGG